MAKRKRWEGPFKFQNGSDGKCVKCDAKWLYWINFGGYPVAVCREHAIEGLPSKEGGRTTKEAEAEVAEIDAEQWRSVNTYRLTWVPVAERLPKKGEWVMVAKDAGAVCESRHDGNGEFYMHESRLYPTHWMPLPEPPRAVTWAT